MDADYRRLVDKESEPFVRNISVSREDWYPIQICPGLLDQWPARLDALASVRSARVWVVTDTTVWRLLGKRFMAAAGAGQRVQQVFQMEPGEQSKSIAGWLRILGWLSELGVRRRDVLLALGGSVISDTVGFAASAFMRGIQYVNVPTSLLAQVDGSVGGKVAVNTSSAKNLVGAFHNPSTVLIDPTTLASLPLVELSNGMAEVIKSFVTSPDGRFRELLSHIPACLDGDVGKLSWVVRVAVSQKMDLVDLDPYERELNRALNLGHTLGHAIEAYRQYRDIRHGMAVAIGIACATRLGLNRGVTVPAAADLIFAALRAADLPTTLPAEDVPGVVEMLETIVAVRDGRLRFVLPRTIGHMEFADDITPDELVKAASG